MTLVDRELFDCPRYYERVGQLLLRRTTTPLSRSFLSHGMTTDNYVLIETQTRQSHHYYYYRVNSLYCGLYHYPFACVVVVWKVRRVAETIASLIVVPQLQRRLYSELRVVVPQQHAVLVWVVALEV
jgi:hypothetical protein